MADKSRHISLSDFNELVPDSSLRVLDIAVAVVEKDPGLFKPLLEFALEDRGQYAMRAARVINFYTVKHPAIIKPYLPLILSKLTHLKNDGLKRELVKTIATLPYPYDEEMAGILVDTCFTWLNDPGEKVALRVYSLEILYRIAKHYPDLNQELISSIEHQLPEASAGLKSRGRKILVQLGKVQK